MGFFRRALRDRQILAHPDHVMPGSHLVARIRETAQLHKPELLVQVHAAVIGHGDAGVCIEVPQLLHLQEQSIHQLAANALTLDAGGEVDELKIKDKKDAKSKKNEEKLTDDEVNQLVNIINKVM